MAASRTPSADALPAGTGVFSRQASGLVRVGGALDVFVYNVGLVSIGFGVAYNQFFGPSLYPGARPAVGTLVAAVGLLAAAATFYLFISIFPRSGGIYVFLSRTIHPGAAFALSLTETVVEMYLAAVASSLIVTVGISPFLATVGAVARNQTMLDWAAATASPTGGFWIGLLILVVAGLLLTSGTRRYFVAQKALFAIAIGGLVMLAGLLAFASRATFAAHLSSLGGLDYDKVVGAAQANGYTHKSFDLGASALFLVWPFVALNGSLNSVAFSGEVKRVRRSQLRGIFGALICCALVIALFDLLATHAFGDAFQGAIAYNSINGVAGGSTESTIGATPYITVLSGILAGNIPLAVIILATFTIWIWFWIPGLIMYSTRSMIAWSFDRVAPDRLGYVSNRFHTPVVAIWTFTAGAAVCLGLIEFRHLQLFRVAEVFTGIWAVVLLAAIIFPYRRRSIYAGSPVSGLRILGLPMITVTGTLGLAFFALVFSLLWNDPIAAGPLITWPLPGDVWLTGGAAILGGLWYAMVRAYRRRHGIDIRLAFRQIPIE